MMDVDPDDRDGEPDPPGPDCRSCGSELPSAPAGHYVDCYECGGCALSFWPAPTPDPTAEEERAYNDAWELATAREYLAQLDAALAHDREVIITLASYARAERVAASTLRDALFYAETMDRPPSPAPPPRFDPSFGGGPSALAVALHTLDGEMDGIVRAAEHSFPAADVALACVRDVGRLVAALRLGDERLASLALASFFRRRA